MMMPYEHHKRKAEAGDGKQTCRRKQTRVWTGENDSKTPREDANYIENIHKFVFKRKRIRVDEALFKQ